MSQFSGLENKKILVVEDVEINQYLARHIMESWGCVVEIAENGACAVEKINAGHFDLVLMDIQMPVMDGVQATKVIRAMEDDNKSSIPIVALTANIGRGEFNIYYKVGMNDCLAKPFEESALFRIVEKNIRKREVEHMKGIANKEDSGTKIVLGEDQELRKLYDLTMIESISGGDRSFVNKMLLLLLETVPVTLKNMHSATDARDWLTLSKYAHKLKSTIDSMSIKDLKEDIRTVEINGKAGQDAEELPALVNRIDNVMQKVMQQIKKDYSL